MHDFEMLMTKTVTVVDTVTFFLLVDTTLALDQLHYKHFMFKHEFTYYQLITYLYFNHLIFLHAGWFF